MASGNQYLTELGLNNLGFSKLDLELSQNLQCEYYEVDEFQNKIKGKKDIFSLISLNIRSISNKMDQLQDLINEISSETFSFSVLCLQELWSIPNIENVQIDGYNFESLLRKGKKGGGNRDVPKVRSAL